MTFREGESRIRGENIRENFARLNRLALMLLKQNPEKTSIHLKRQARGWVPGFLMQIPTGIARKLRLDLGRTFFAERVGDLLLRACLKCGGQFIKQGRESKQGKHLVSMPAPFSPVCPLVWNSAR